MNEDQEAELLALKSIFDEETLEISDQKDGGRFIVQVEAPNGDHVSLLVGSSKDESKRLKFYTTLSLGPRSKI